MEVLQRWRPFYDNMDSDADDLQPAVKLFVLSFYLHGNISQILELDAVFH